MRPIINKLRRFLTLLFSSKDKLQFIQYVSHQINGQFSGMRVILKLLLLENKLTETDRKAMLDDLWNSCQHLHFVLNNLLEFSKFEINAAGKAVYLPTEVRSLLTTIIDLSRYAAAEKGIKVISLLSNSLPDTMLCDPLMLSQIAGNLINNAIKFSGPDALIFVELALEEDRWRLAVTDQGNGIPAKKLTHIFNPFFSENESGEPSGLGLGLHICKRLVTSMDGEIKVDSQMGKGSVFTVHWPVREQTGLSV